ncbi:MAG: hypothetical protein KO464_02225 [Candidatus Methanofastidiosum sp.]|nr:hypothetical protein [Methanofastidiosum sp.]
MLFRVQIFHKTHTEAPEALTLPFEQATVRLELNSASVTYTFSPRPELMLLPPGTRFVLQFKDEIDGEWKAAVDSYLISTPFRMSPSLYVSIETQVPLNWALETQSRFSILFLTAGALRPANLGPEFELYGQEVPNNLNDIEQQPSLFTLLDSAAQSREFGGVSTTRVNDSSMLFALVKHFVNVTSSGKALENRHKVLQRFGVMPSAGQWILEYGLRPKHTEMAISQNLGGGPVTLGSLINSIAGTAGFSMYPQFGFKENELNGVSFLTQYLLLPTTYTTQAPLSNVIFPHDIQAFEMYPKFDTPTRLLGYMTAALDPSGMAWPVVFAKQASTKDVNTPSPGESSKRLELSALEELTGIRAYETSFPVNSMVAKDIAGGDANFYNSADPFGLVHKSRITLQEARVSQQYSKIIADFNPYAIVGAPGIVMVSGLPYRGEVRAVTHQLDTRSGAFTTTYTMTGVKLLPVKTTDAFEICDGMGGHLQDDMIDKIYHDSFGTVTPLGLDNYTSPFWTQETRSNIDDFSGRRNILIQLLEYIGRQPEATAKALTRRLRYRPLASIDKYKEIILPQNLEDLPHSTVADEVAATLITLLQKSERGQITQKNIADRATAALQTLEQLKGQGDYAPLLDLLLGEYGILATKLTMKAE